MANLLGPELAKPTALTPDQAAARSQADKRSAYWVALAYPQRHCHAEWADDCSDWPQSVRLNLQSFEAPASLANLLSRNQADFSVMLIGAGLVWYAEAIRKVISGRERAQLNALLGPELIAALQGLGQVGVMPGQAAASDASALLKGGASVASNAGIALLAGCTHSFGTGWSHCLKIRVPRAKASVVDHAVALSREAAEQRIDWFSDQLPALTEQQCIGHFVARSNNESSAN